MGEGLGGWGARHPARHINPRTRTVFRHGAKYFLFFSSLFSCRAAPVPPSGGAAARVGPGRQIGRQVDLAAVRKFEISQADAAGAALDHIAGADREPGRKTTDLATHASLPTHVRTLQLRQLCMTDVPIP